LPRTFAAIHFKPELKQRTKLKRKVVTEMGGNAGYKGMPVGGEVSLDILLYGK
jgi:hypothetical protein